MDWESRTDLQIAWGEESATNWRDLCRVKWVGQEHPNGCGVACLAMLSATSYAYVSEMFVQQGLGVGQGRKRPFASNFRDLMAVAEKLGLQGAMRRWRGWAAVEGVGVLKVPSKPPNWHWVVVERTQRFGVVVQDPAMDWPAFERAPLDVLYRSPESLSPYGNWISFA